MIKKIYLFFLIILISKTAFSEIKLKFNSEITFQTGEIYQETEIGGLSGINYEPNSKKLFAISDDRSQINPARFYEFEVLFQENKFSIKPIKVTKLKNLANQYFEKDEVDFEDIAILKNNLIITSEGKRDPEIFLFNLQGLELKKIKTPKQYLSQNFKGREYGTRKNLSFEALCASDKSNDFWIGMEEALYQDGPVSTASQGSFVRILHFEQNNIKNEYIYPLDPIPDSKSIGINLGVTGLSGMLCLDSKNFITIERAFLPFSKKNVIKLFKTTITPNSLSILEFKNLEKPFNGHQLNPLKKELISNFDMIEVPDSFDKIKLDNIEGITFGPTLPNGNKTIILVSDNNFSKNQKTQFIIFEITGLE